MIKTIKITDKNFNMKSSAFTPFAYKNFTGNSLLKDLGKFKDLQLKEIQENLDIEIAETIIDKILKVSYVMIEECDKSQVSNYEEFLKQLQGSLFEDVSWIGEVIELAITPFSTGKIKTS